MLGPWSNLKLTLIVGSARLLDPRCHRRVGLKAIEGGPAASEIYSLFSFLSIFMESWSCGSVLGASGEGLIPKAHAKGYS